MNKTWTIYAIKDPRTMRPGYVGMSELGKARLGQHCSVAASGSTKKDAWIRELIGDGVRPVFEELEIVKSKSGAVSAEIRWIKKLIRDGENLMNHQHSKSMHRSYYLRMPDDVDAALEAERIRRVEETKDNVTFTDVVLDIIKRGLASLNRSRKRKGRND